MIETDWELTPEYVHPDGETCMAIIPERQLEALFRLTDMCESDLQKAPQYLGVADKQYAVLIRDDFELLSNLRPEIDHIFKLDCGGNKGASGEAYIDYCSNKPVFVVLRGSVMADKDSALRESRYSYDRQCAKERDSLVDDNRIVASWTFQRSWDFRTPSQAARVLMGCAKSGNEAWHDGFGKSPGDIVPSWRR